MISKKIFHVFQSIFGSVNTSKQKEVNKKMKSEFLNSISFEEDPFEGEIPEMIQLFDLDGKEVDS